MAESLERGKIAATDRQQDYFRIIGQECRRLSSLIENVLDFSRIDQGRQRYELEPTDVAALIGQTLELMRPYATARTVNLITAEPQSARSDLAGTNQPQLLVDSRALQQALINLIDNAVKHSPPGGLVTVGLDPDPASSPATPHRSGDYDNDGGRNPHQPSVRIWVQDQGPGIPARDHERIFEPFLRLGSELERETPGAGIGLSIVKHVVDAHHGRVWVESTPGQGSRFTIEIPI